MHPLVRSFRKNIVENRFIVPLGVTAMIGMRLLLFLSTDFAQITCCDSPFLQKYAELLFADRWVSFIISTVSLFLIAGLLSVMDSRFTLIRTRTYLPFVVPLFLLSLHPRFLVMTGDYVAVILIVSAFFPLLKSYQQPVSYLFSFRSAVLIAVASLFRIHTLWLLLLWWKGERSMRGSQLRSFVAFLFGIFLVYCSVFSLFFFFDDLPGFLAPFRMLTHFSLPPFSGFSPAEWAVALLTLLFFILNMMLSIRIYAHDKVIILCFMEFLVQLIILFLLLQLVYWGATIFPLMLSLVGVSFLNAYFYTMTTSTKEIYLAALFLALILLFYLVQLFSDVPLLG